jgi:probable phosphoglycerate mutase
LTNHSHHELAPFGEDSASRSYSARVEATRIVLIRHGESVAQRRQIVAGHAGCQGLSERGREEAAALRDRLAASGELNQATVLYASVMARAVETAAIIAPAISGQDVLTDCDFCEHHPGQADGLSWAEANRLYPPSATWEPDSRRVPGAETWQEMHERVGRSLDNVARRHAGQTVVIVCHGGVIVHSMIRWLGLRPAAEPGQRARLEPVNTSITEWRLESPPPADQHRQIRLVRFNDHAHLCLTASSPGY